MPSPFGLVQVQTHLVGQALAVQAPSLGERAPGQEPAEPTQRRPAIHLLLERDLEVVTRVGLVVRGRGELMLRLAGKVETVDVVHAGPGPVLGGLVVERERHVGLAELLDEADLAVGARDPPEPRGRQVPAPPDLLLRGRLELLRRPEAERRILRDRGLGGGGVGVAEDRGRARTFGLDLLEVGGAELVDLASVELERRPRQDLGGVHRLAAREVPRPIVSVAFGR
jgi:hypothetical protein